MRACVCVCVCGCFMLVYTLFCKKYLKINKIHTVYTNCINPQNNFNNNMVTPENISLKYPKVN